MTIHDHHKASSRKRRTPAPVVPTAEQLEAQALREARHDAYQAAREALLNAAQALAERLQPGRVTRYRTPLSPDFSIMFGVSTDPLITMAGPGLVELQVRLSHWERLPDSDEYVAPSLTFTPRSFSLGSSCTLEHCAALGQALLDAATCGRTILALTYRRLKAPL